MKQIDNIYNKPIPVKLITSIGDEARRLFNCAKSFFRGFLEKEIKKDGGIPMVENDDDPEAPAVGETVKIEVRFVGSMRIPHTYGLLRSLPSVDDCTRLEYMLAYIYIYIYIYISRMR